MATYNNYFRGRLKAYYIQRLSLREYKHGWMKGDCPECGRHDKFGVNLNTNRTNCFVCGFATHPLNLMMDLEGLQRKEEAFKYLNQDSFDGYEFKEDKIDIAESKVFHLPEGFKLLTEGSSTLAKAARNYIRSRGFNPTIMANKGWGYCNTGIYFGYIIMPFKDEDGRLIYYNTRNFLSTGPRFNNPNTDVTGLGKSFIWYNRVAFFLYDMVYITEGVFNAETIGVRATASGGKFVSRYQINDLIKSPVKKLILLVDPDAKDKAISLAYKLYNFKKIKLVFFPDGEDPNSMGRKRSMLLIRNTRYIKNYSDITKIKNSI